MVKETLTKYKVALLPAATSLVSAGMAFPALATESEPSGGSEVTAADWSSVISALTDQINVSSVVAVLATFVAAGVGLAFMWWGVRKGIRSLMSAFRKGRVSV